MNRSNNNFVNALKNAHQNQSTLKKKTTLKADHFNTTTTTTTNEQTSFDGEIVESNDPLFPGIRLVKRYISREDLAKAIPSNTDCLLLTQLLKQVHPPEFCRPLNSNANFVVFGIVATKSISKTSSNGKKYMTFILSDLKYDIVLSLHGKAQETHYKVQPGTLIALFNPSFYVTNNGQNKVLNLSILKNHCLLEIGQCSDLGQCLATTTSNRRCRNWVDVRKTHFCEFHIEQKALSTKRPELSSLNGKLWDPKQSSKFHTSKMTVVSGGEVAWKQGLQVDNLAPKIPKGVPDAPVGSLFLLSGNDNKMFEQSVASKLKDKQRKKRELNRAVEDSMLVKKLSKNKVSKTGGSADLELRRLGFRRKVREDSDSDLEII